MLIQACFLITTTVKYKILLLGASLSGCLGLDVNNRIGSLSLNTTRAHTDAQARTPMHDTARAR